MATETEKSVKLHLVTPIIYSNGGQLGWVTNVIVYYPDDEGLDLVIHNGELYSRVVGFGYEEILCHIKETEEEVRSMVDGKLNLTEFSEKI